MLSLEYVLFGFAFLVMFALFLALNYVAFTTYTGFISSKVITLPALLWALLWQFVSLLPLLLAMEARARSGIAFP